MSANSVSEFSVVFKLQTQDLQTKTPANCRAVCSGASPIATGNNKESESDVKDAHGSVNAQDAPKRRDSGEQPVGSICAEKERDAGQSGVDASKEKDQEVTKASSVDDLLEETRSTAHKTQEFDRGSDVADCIPAALVPSSSVPCTTSTKSSPSSHPEAPKDGRGSRTKTGPLFATASSASV